MRRIQRSISAIVGIVLLGSVFALNLSAQTTQAPPHLAGKVVDQGANFTIHPLSFVPIRPNEYCGGGRYPTLNLQVVFDVADDFQLDEAYLMSVLPYSRLRDIADRICPDAVIITTSHFFKGRFIGPKKEIADQATLSRTRREMAFSTLNYSNDQGNKPVYTNRLGIKGRSWNDVKAFNDAGFKTEDQIAFEREREKERQAYKAKSDAIAKVRSDYFQARKAELSWPSGDNWMFDVYMAGRQSGPPPPPRSPEWSRQLRFDYPTRGGMVLAYVEEARKKCGALSPNGTAPIGFTLTDGDTGAEVNRQTFPVDVKLYDLYRAEKLSTGAYNAISLSLIKSYQDDMAPLFARWACDGPQFARFIDGILKTED